MSQKKPNKYIPGDLFILPDGHNTVVVEINENGWPVKIKSLEPDERLGKEGWFKEGNDWIVFYLDILSEASKN